MPKIETLADFDDLRKRVRLGVAAGIGSTAMAAASFVRESMPGPGASGSDSKNRGTGQNDTWTPSNPGTPPGMRKGAAGGLVSTINEAKVNEYMWIVGTNSPYARIHEFGGTINHPGGTPYIVTKDGAVFIKKETAARLISEGKTVKYTKPHTINMPARPFFAVTIDQRAADLREIFLRSFQRAFLKG